MSVVPLIVDIAAIFCIIACLHYHYGNWRKHHVIVTVATFLAWFLPSMIIFVLPIDVSSTCYNRCVSSNDVATTIMPSTEIHTQSLSTVTMSTNSSTLAFEEDTKATDVYTSPTTNADMMSVASGWSDAKSCRKPLSYVSGYTLSVLWHVVYWTSQALTWVLLPIMQSYAKAGEFTVLGKMKYALITNAIYYGTYLLIFGVCLIYVAAKPELHFNAAQMKVLAITASNTWGLALLVLLFGYGLVEVPRLCWNMSKQGYSLSRTYFKIAKMSLERIEAEEALEDALSEVRRVSEAVRTSHPYRRFVDTIISKCPDSTQLSLPTSAAGPQRPHDDFVGLSDSSANDVDLSQTALVRLHRRVIVSVEQYNSTQCQWNKLIENAVYLEDVGWNQSSGSHVFVRSLEVGRKSVWMCCRCPRLEWYWKCWIIPWSLRLVTVLMVILTLMVVWSECVFFIKTPVLSLFAIFLNVATTHSYNYFAIEFLCVVTISYLSICAYYTVFKMRIFNYYVVVGNHHTDENSLIFCGMMLCRLTPPLCLNFLGLMHLDSHIIADTGIVETSYTQFMGHMDIISFISDGFNIYFPIGIVLLCILTWFSVGQRVLHLIGFQQFIGDDDMTQELIDEGTQLVTRERRKQERREETEARRRTWHERFGERSDSPSAAATDVQEAGRKRAGRLVKDTDRSELLHQAEPIDYSGAQTSSAHGDLTRGLYQAGDAGPRPLQQTGGDWSVMSGSGRTGRQAPPRGIFDDV